ncbi:hypothetical protein [Microlunatus speluncae]|uniref:hypothetical protein n=1 Tax=Microlunatus speluncae TaxID=2594267 RepID=UPI0012662A2A|nr:hypothetical protein [Microlunatus speluncae]
MSIDLFEAESFLTRHGRLLDRRRFELLLGRGSTDAVLAALDGYRNPDGGYGWGLEPDLRAPESQPGGALHAFEVLAELGAVTTPRSAQLCDWLESVTLPDGGLPFALPVADGRGSAPFWVEADPTESTLHSTAFVVGVALRVAVHDRAVADHAWIERAIAYCLGEIEKLDAAPHAIALAFTIQFLDALSDSRPAEAAALLERLGRYLPEDGVVPVAGGSPDEAIRPLIFAPLPGRPARRLFSDAVINADLDRLAAAQHEDGGWRVDFASYSPAAELEWSGYETVRAVSVLRANGRT